MNIQKQKGFMLIEMIVVLAISTTIAIAVYAKKLEENRIQQANIIGNCISKIIDEDKQRKSKLYSYILGSQQIEKTEDAILFSIKKNQKPFYLSKIIENRIRERVESISPEEINVENFSEDNKQCNYKIEKKPENEKPKKPKKPNTDYAWNPSTNPESKQNWKHSKQDQKTKNEFKPWH